MKLSLGLRTNGGLPSSVIGQRRMLQMAADDGLAASGRLISIFRVRVWGGGNGWLLFPL
jgi:hypothetical protein